MRMLTMWGSCFGVCAGAAAGRRLSAQTSELHLGDVARVSTTTPPLRRLVGRVVTLTNDTLALQTDEPVARIAIPMAALTSTERRLPSASRAGHTLAGAALGFLSGAAIGGIAGAVGSKPCANGADGPCGRGAGAAFAAVGGGLVGVLIGTTIGVTMPVERWSPVPIRLPVR
jgi:hypothetical protein